MIQRSVRQKDPATLRLEDEPDYSPDDEDDEPPYGDKEDDDDEGDDDDDEEEETWQVAP